MGTAHVQADFLEARREPADGNSAGSIWTPPILPNEDASARSVRFWSESSVTSLILYHASRDYKTGKLIFEMMQRKATREFELGSACWFLVKGQNDTILHMMSTAAGLNSCGGWRNCKVLCPRQHARRGRPKSPGGPVSLSRVPHEYGTPFGKLPGLLEKPRHPPHIIFSFLNMKEALPREGTTSPRGRQRRL